MTAQGYGHGAMGRKRKTLIVVCDAKTAGEARKAWDSCALFQVLTSEGLGKMVDKRIAAQQGVSEVTVRFTGGSIDVLVVP